LGSGFEKAQGSVISNPIAMKFGTIIVQVNNNSNNNNNKNTFVECHSTIASEVLAEQVS